ncbi:hypothetical protein [Litchfieldia salsa]|uniref:Uncharacterized protein n=1 Tax=Litchfieldia salsa TaxID=930152 RepID=A0A1H0SVX9_9BACI|nr:hypothetical protein [Litchfieldia salsa]SDP45871.1 hypothetical protein SAMN05216565_103147 [Litchfieldia salsa]
MEANTQTSRNIEIVQKKDLTIRTVLNIYGVFAVIVLILSIFTTNIFINENMVFVYNENLMMGKKKIKEFLSFIFGSAIVFFTCVNLYYRKLK